MNYIYLSIAIVVEVAATSALKASDGFTKMLPTIVVIGGYGIAFYLLSIIVKTLPVGLTYAIWAGLGIILVAIVGAVLYKQVPDLPAIIGMTLIVAGVVIINLFSKMTSH